MKCPSCEVQLLMSDRSGVEIDYCPKCRGVWLDRGELDKIIEKEMMMKSQSGQRMNYHNEGYKHHDNNKYSDHHDSHFGEGSHYGKHKKRGFMSDLFDF